MPRARGYKESIEDKRARLRNDIRDIRLARGHYNAEILSKELGFGWNNVPRWETGVTEPSVTAAIKLARKLGCTVEELYAPYVERLPKR